MNAFISVSKDRGYKLTDNDRQTDKDRQTDRDKARQTDRQGQTDRQTQNEWFVYCCSESVASSFKLL